MRLFKEHPCAEEFKEAATEWFDTFFDPETEAVARDVSGEACDGFIPFTSGGFTVSSLVSVQDEVYVTHLPPRFIEMIRDKSRYYELEALRDYCGEKNVFAGDSALSPEERQNMEEALLRLSEALDTDDIAKAIEAGNPIAEEITGKITSDVYEDFADWLEDRRPYVLLAADFLYYAPDKRRHDSNKDFRVFLSLNFCHPDFPDQNSCITSVLDHHCGLPETVDDFKAILDTFVKKLEEKPAAKKRMSVRQGA